MNSVHTPDRQHGLVFFVQALRDERLERYVSALRRSQLTPVVMTDARAVMRLRPMADLIVTDTLLPGGMDGLELIRRLRGDTRTRHIPIVVLTACAWQTERERAMKAGCDAFLENTAPAGEFLLVVDRLLASVVHPSSSLTGRGQKPCQCAAPEVEGGSVEAARLCGEISA